MKVFYKYTKKKHALDLFNKGIIRVGTLYGYRQIEKHGQEIGDIEEGRKHIKTLGVPLDTVTPGIMPKTMEVVRQRIHASNIRIEASELITISNSDLYVFSTSSELSYEVMKRMNPLYDVCIRIDDDNAFFQKLSECLKKRIPNLNGPYNGTCVYIKREQLYSNENDYHPALIKDPKYDYQKEMRVMWEPTDLSKKIEPVEITCPELARSCSLIEF